MEVREEAERLRTPLVAFFSILLECRKSPTRLDLLLDLPPNQILELYEGALGFDFYVTRPAKGDIELGTNVAGPMGEYILKKWVKVKTIWRKRLTSS